MWRTGNWIPVPPLRVLTKGCESGLDYCSLLDYDMVTFDDIRELQLHSFRFRVLVPRVE